MKGEKIRMKDLAERFHEVGVVPVVVLEDVKDAVPLAQALVEGGLPCWRRIYVMNWASARRT